MDGLGLPTSFGRPDHRKRPVKNSRRSNKKPQILNQLVDNDVEAVFNKHYSFYNDKEGSRNIFKLPQPSLMFQEAKWNVDQFQQLKLLLNNTKSKLNDLNLKEWHFHTTNTNIAGDVIKRLKHALGPEFLTQAWCKMYECLWMFWMVPQQFEGGRLNSVHLCEAPGAFITALNHFLQTWYPDTQWDWLATTLNPYHESNPLSHMIQDDRFILHTLRNWTFGRDGTGDLMKLDNLHHLQEQVDSRLDGQVMLVTADGSIDCQTNPAEQESIVAPLHFCETLAALSILQPGGSFMLKMFTMLECESICLLYLLVCSFNTVNVFKPVKSKEGNSEVYVVCTEYIGKEKLAPWLPTLLEKYGSDTMKAMFSEEDIPEEFKIQVYECAKMFTDMQISVIERNLDLFYFPTPPKLLYSRLMKQKVADAYLDHYKLQPIDKFIIGNNVLAGTPSFNLAQKQEEGTFNDRVRQATLDQPYKTVVHRLWQRVVEVSATCVWPHSASVCWFVFNTKQMPEIQLTIAQPVNRVCSSKFCNGRLLEVFSQLNYPQLHVSLQTELSTGWMIDVSQLPWFTESSRCNLQLLEQLAAALETLPVSKSLCIRGLPLLTQFTVGLVLLLAHSFYQLGLSVEGDVFLCGYKQAVNTTEWVRSVLGNMQRLTSHYAVLSLLPVNILCDAAYSMEEGESFYLCVSKINNARLLQSIENEIQRILPSDPAIIQSGPAILQIGTTALQEHASLLHGDPAILQSWPAIVPSDSTVQQSEPMTISTDPVILQSDTTSLQDHASLLHGDPAIIQCCPAKITSDSKALQSEPMSSSDPAILQCLPAAVPSDSTALQSEPMSSTDPAILQSLPAAVPSDSTALQSEPMSSTDPAILQCRPAIVPSDSRMLQSETAKSVPTDPAILRSGPEIIQYELGKQQTDPGFLYGCLNVLKGDSMLLQSERKSEKSDLVISPSGSKIVQIDPAILRIERAIVPIGNVSSHSELSTTQDEDVKLQVNTST